jgi:hypothetical protein
VQERKITVPRIAARGEPVTICAIRAETAVTELEKGLEEGQHTKEPTPPMSEDEFDDSDAEAMMEEITTSGEGSPEEDDQGRQEAQIGALGAMLTSGPGPKGMFH